MDAACPSHRRAFFSTSSRPRRPAGCCCSPAPSRRWRRPIRRGPMPYHALWATQVGIGAAGHELSLSVHHWINDGLMAVFFLLVGLEVKREALAGELSSLRQAALPIAGAIGGMVVPVLIYLAASGGGIADRGWAVAMATDIAFALGRPDAGGAARAQRTEDLSRGAGRSSTTSAPSWSSRCSTRGRSPGQRRDDGRGLRRRADRAQPAARPVADAVPADRASRSGSTSTSRVCTRPLPASSWPWRFRSAPASTPRKYSAQARDLLAEFDRTETGDLLVLTSKGQQEADVRDRPREPAGARAPPAPGARAPRTLGVPGDAAVRVFERRRHPVGPVRRSRDAGGVPRPGDRQAAGHHRRRVRRGSRAERPDCRKASAGARCTAAAGSAAIGFTMSLFIATLAFEGTPLLASAKVGILAASAFAGIVGGTIVRLGLRPHSTRR